MSLNPSLEINFSIAEPWLQIGDKVLKGYEIMNWHMQNQSHSYHCICGAALNWNGATLSHYPCWYCRYNGNYKKPDFIIDYEI